MTATVQEWIEELEEIKRLIRNGNDLPNATYDRMNDLRGFIEKAKAGE